MNPDRYREAFRRPIRSYEHALALYRETCLSFGHGSRHAVKVRRELRKFIDHVPENE